MSKKSKTYIEDSGVMRKQLALLIDQIRQLRAMMALGLSHRVTIHKEMVAALCNVGELCTSFGSGKAVRVAPSRAGRVKLEKRRSPILTRDDSDDDGKVDNDVKFDVFCGKKRACNQFVKYTRYWLCGPAFNDSVFFTSKEGFRTRLPEGGK